MDELCDEPICVLAEHSDDVMHEDGDGWSWYPEGAPEEDDEWQA